VSSETLNRARVSKNTKSSIKTRERERERERERRRRRRRNSKPNLKSTKDEKEKRKKTKKKNKEKETDSMMELRKPTKMKVHTFVFYVLFFCKEKIGSRGRRNN
jgi:hypothetical protein